LLLDELTRELEDAIEREIPDIPAGSRLIFKLGFIRIVSRIVSDIEAKCLIEIRGEIK